MAKQSTKKNQAVDPKTPDKRDKGKLAVKGSSAKRGLVTHDPLASYLEKVRGIPRLTAEEEHLLAVQLRKHGDRGDALRLVTSHLYLVIAISFEFRHQFQNMLDLIQEGNIGLMRAVERFDPFKGVRLPTYAAYWVRAYILKYILDNWRLVRVGTTNTRRKLLFNLNKVTEQLRASGIDPSPKRLAEHFSASEEDVQAVQKSLGSSDVSLDANVAGDSKRTYAEVIGDDAPAVDDTLGERQIIETLKEKVDEFSKELKPVAREILYDRLMSDEPVTLAQIGQRHGVTREAIRQSEARLVKKLKAYLEEKMPGISGFQFVSRKKGKTV